MACDESERAIPVCCGEPISTSSVSVSVQLAQTSPSSAASPFGIVAVQTAPTAMALSATTEPSMRTQRASRVTKRADGESSWSESQTLKRSAPSRPAAAASACHRASGPARPLSPASVRPLEADAEPAVPAVAGP